MQQRTKAAPAVSVSGRMKWFNNASGQGFITRDDTGTDVFVHFRGISDPALRVKLGRVDPVRTTRAVRDALMAEIRVRFDVVDDPRNPGKPLAISVRLLEKE